MKILFVASDFPWPKRQGGHLRLATALEGLSALGEMDLFALDPYHRPDLTVPAGIHVSRLKVVAPRGSRHQLGWRVTWLARRGIPLEVVRDGADPLPGRELKSWASSSYDLVWFDRAATFERTGRPRFGPTIVDLHDLEDVKARLRVQLIRGHLQRKSAVPSLRRSLATVQARLNGNDWRLFQRSVARDVDRVVLSSELDRRRSGLPNAVVVPNSYGRPGRPAGRLQRARPAVALFQATFDYAPNVDAADWLVDEVAPPLRSLIPDLEVRLVGKPVPAVTRHHRPPTVTVVGEVPAMEPELARAGVAVVPIRYGSGTRLKILESFAHRVPVVSTRVGAEGLDVENGVHLLLADQPEDFAAACVRVLTETDLTQRLVGAAERRYLERYESEFAREQVKTLALEVAGTGRS